MGELELGAGGLGGVIVGVELFGVELPGVGLGGGLFDPDPLEAGALAEVCVIDEPLVADGLFEELEVVGLVPLEPLPAAPAPAPVAPEFVAPGLVVSKSAQLALLTEFAAPDAVEVPEAGTTADVLDVDEFDGDGLVADGLVVDGLVVDGLVGLPLVPAFASPDLLAAVGSGGEAGASSGIDGAVGAAGCGSSARRIPAALDNRARANPPVSTQRRAREARTVVFSTRMKSITVGPAYSDALRNGSRPGRFTKQRRVGGRAIEIESGEESAGAQARNGSSGKQRESRDIRGWKCGGRRWRGAYKYLRGKKLSRRNRALAGCRFLSGPSAK